MSIRRRDFLLRCAAVGAACAAGCSAADSGPSDRRPKPVIHTVRGPISPSQFGLTLAHEHILCDFIGADKTDPSRWNPDEVFKVMLPRLRDIRKRGITGFVDCTPAFIGRDPRLLARLSEAAGIHILTNTGYYGAAGDKYVPAHARTDSVDQLAERWVREFGRGIGDSQIKPGFLKVGVDPIRELSAGPDFGLSDIDARIIRAAARAHMRTGLAIASHTGQGLAALAQVTLLEQEQVAPASFIFVHADSESDSKYEFELARKGVWIEYDGIASRPPEYCAKRITKLLEHTDRILLSMDSGWYNAGQPGGGRIRDYNYMTDVFLPALRQNGFTEETIHKLTVANPAKAFAVTGRDNST